MILSVVLEVGSPSIVSRSQSQDETLRQSRTVVDEQCSESAACWAVQTASSVDLLGRCENWRGSRVEGAAALMWPGRILWKLFLMIFLER